jgi:hypothetical protein
MMVKNLEALNGIGEMVITLDLNAADVRILATSTEHPNQATAKVLAPLVRAAQAIYAGDSQSVYVGGA